MINRLPIGSMAQDLSTGQRITTKTYQNIYSWY